MFYSSLTTANWDPDAPYITVARGDWAALALQSLSPDRSRALKWDQRRWWDKCALPLETSERVVSSEKTIFLHGSWFSEFGFLPYLSLFSKTKVSAEQIVCSSFTPMGNQWTARLTVETQDTSKAHHGLLGTCGQTQRIFFLLHILSTSFEDGRNYIKKLTDNDSYLEIEVSCIFSGIKLQPRFPC